MSAEVLIAKENLRREIKRNGQQIPLEERQAASGQICNSLQNSELWHQAKSVFLFSPVPDEPDIRPLVATAVAAGKLVALPRYDIGLQTYAAALIEDFALHCVQGKYGIVEPSSDRRSFDLMHLDLALVPGVCFDASGRRLGRGKGFYDRLLAQVHGIKCGLAFEWQVVPEVPAEPHDVCLNCILTPIRWLKS